jgi:hypothetical protein
LYGVDVTQQIFLSQPIRDVEVRYVRQAACGAFAIVTVDFEPTAWDRVQLAISSDVRLDFGGYDQDYQSVLGCIEGLARGITEELDTRPDLDVRVKVILRRIVFHPVDSNELSFQYAGRLVARTAIERLTATTPNATTPTPAPSHPTIG